LSVLRLSNKDLS